ncbi:hypothetical protein ACH40E_03085 [Streptomyces acidicola]|uniref:hypothetical protein n=1 Tax=Streptomyces acidicola TaxID=2596892 RepID=UPI0037B70D85
MKQKHFNAGLFFGAVAAAVAYADDASPLGCLAVGGLVAVAVWAAAYALDH